jgi:hypothetical protein
MSCLKRRTIRFDCCKPGAMLAGASASAGRAKSAFSSSSGALEVVNFKDNDSTGDGWQPRAVP